MSLSENLQFLRARQGLTQEQLAERLDVSRQSVSKWESGMTYPEMETLLKLCDLFGTDLDTLLRGSAEQALAEDSAGYDAFMTGFARKISGAVAGIIAGVGAASALNAFAVPEALSMALLLIVIAAAVVVMVVGGIQYDNFCRRWPTLTDFYSQEEKDRFQQRFVWYIAGGVGAILCGVALLCLAFYFFPEREPYESACAAAFLFVVAGAVYTLVYGGMTYDKYNVEKYNRSNNPTPEEKEKRQRAGAACGVIMLLATGIYVGLGLSCDLWDKAWWVFAVGAILCGAASLLLGPREED